MISREKDHISNDFCSGKQPDDDHFFHKKAVSVHPLPSKKVDAKNTYTSTLIRALLNMLCFKKSFD